MSSETALMSKARRHLALHRAGEAIDMIKENPANDSEMWDAAYALEVEKANRLDRGQLMRELAGRKAAELEKAELFGREPIEVPDCEVDFKSISYVHQLLKEDVAMKAAAKKEVSEAKALARVRELKAKADAKIDEEEAMRRIHEMLTEEGNNIERAKAYGLKPFARKRPCARMMCVKSNIKQSSFKEEKKVMFIQRHEPKKWRRQFLITLQDKGLRKLKSILVTYSSDSEDCCEAPTSDGEEEGGGWIDQKTYRGPVKSVRDEDEVWFRQTKRRS